MIASAFKKLAKENGMQIDRGVAYGNLGGFAATLSEGAGYKRIVFSTVFTDPVRKTGFMDQINGTDVKKEFRVQNLGIGPRTVQVDFQDNPGTMKKIQAFLEWFLPLLHHYGATGVNVCTECGCVIDHGRWALVNGNSFHFHDSCARKVQQEIESSNVQRVQEDTGSYFTGLLGALGGSLLGAILWAIVMSMGYIASLVGLAMGWFAEKGYNLLKGRQGKAKVLILIIAIILGVLVGTFASEAITVFGMIQNGELPGLTVGDIPWIIYLVLAEDAEYRGAMISNILMGLLFAALGVFALLRQTGKAVSGAKYIDLK